MRGGERVKHVTSENLCWESQLIPAPLYMRVQVTGEMEFHNSYSSNKWKYLMDFNSRSNFSSSIKIFPALFLSHLQFVQCCRRQPPFSSA